jgi:hypothetical protein
MRVALAQSDKVQYALSLEDGEIDEVESKSIELRGKYSLPENLWLCDEEESALTKKNVKDVKKHIAAFVKGSLDENALCDLLFYFEEIRECDYGWILIESSMGFGNDPTREHMDSVIAEIESIGTRSKSKAKNLPKICGMFSSCMNEEYIKKSAS